MITQSIAPAAVLGGTHVPVVRQNPVADKPLMLQLRFGQNHHLMITALFHLLRVLPFLCGGHRQLAVESIALRQQLAVYKQAAKRPRLRPTDRLSGSLGRR